MPIIARVRKRHPQNEQWQPNLPTDVVAPSHPAQIIPNGRYVEKNALLVLCQV
jgi:hypothetical protein